MASRGSVNTLSQMTNPFRTKHYSNPGMTVLSQSDVGHPGQYNGMPLQNSDSKFSSSEENKTTQPGMMQRQDTQTDNDPSSSSMSGYELKGMLSRVRNQASYVQNNVLKNNEPTEFPDQLVDNYDRFRLQHSGTEFSQPGFSKNHQNFSQNTAFAETPFTKQTPAHVLSQ